MISVVELIAQKRSGQKLHEGDIRTLIQSYAQGDVPDYQMAALAMAIFFQGMSPEELAPWTDAMLNSGVVLNLDHIPGAKVDKHSTGGVGDKISLPLAPLVAACGVRVPMISGRGLGHTGGTLDKLESIPGFRTDLSVSRFSELVEHLGLGLIGQTGEICPADKKLYALRDVTATVESIPLIASSIMSKKLAEGIDALVLDVKVGSGAFMVTEERARKLARTMVDIGNGMGKKTVAILTDMNQPLGRMIGNAMEVQESIDILKGSGPADVRALTLTLAQTMLELGGVDPSEAQRALDDGRALECFRKIIEAQGGDSRVIDDASLLPSANHRIPLCASKSGYIGAFDTRRIGLAGVCLGAGRMRKEDEVDRAVGIEVHASIGDVVEAGQPIFWVCHNERGLDAATEHLLGSISIVDEQPTPSPLILGRIE